MAAIVDYPPAGHLLRDLRIEIELARQSGRGWLPWCAEVAAADGGTRIGVLATLVDVVGGGVAMRAAPGRRVVTADLAVQRIRPPTASWVEAELEVLRRGRSTLVADIALHDVGEPGRDRGPMVGCGTLTFALLEGESKELARQMSDDTSRTTFGGGRLERPVVDAVGLIPSDSASAAFTLPVVDYVRNSLGAAQGGVLAVAGDAVAVSAAGAANATRVGEATVVDLHVTYLALGRVGPLTARARLLDPGGEPTGAVTAPTRRVAVVDIVDDGADARRAAIVHATVLVPAAVPVPGARGATADPTPAPPMEGV